MMKRLVSAALAVAVTAAAAAAHADTFDVGTLIVPMDTTYQDSGMLKAYGLVYELLRNGVPVRWVILPGKTVGQADFTASAMNVKTSAAITNYAYRGGPFVIDSADAAAALPIVNAWIATNTAVAVHRATAPFTATVARHLVVAPRVAMFADGNQGIARGYLMAAGIPDSTLDYTWPNTSPDMLTPAQVSGPTTTNHRDGALFDGDGDPVYCQFMSMHWGVSNAQSAPEVVAETREFLKSPTHFYAECQAVNAFENLVPYGHFLTPNGYQIKSQPSAVDYYHPDATFMQIDGNFQTVGGSEPAYALPAGDHYKAGNITMITAHNAAPEAWDLWMTGYLDGACPPEVASCGRLGKVSYLGGHQYTTNVPISSNPKTQGVRLFLNSLFDSNCAAVEGLPLVTLTKKAPASTTSAMVTFTLDYSNAGPSVATGASISDPIPAGSTFVSATSGGMFASGKVTWDLGNLGVGESGSVQLTVMLPAFGSFPNTATLGYKVGLNPLSLTSNTTTTLYDVDTDGDGVLDVLDNCPDVYNPAQDLSGDVTTCGSCTTPCSVANGLPACIGGTCTVANCNMGYADCDGSYANGCEHPTAGFDADVNNCGGCGIVCAYPNAGALCVTGQCVRGACDPAFADCDGVAADGCEYPAGNFASDPSNCGSCGHACGAGLSCVGGGCVISNCPAGFSDCNGVTADGCEYADTGFATDVNNCGGCNLHCAPAHGTGACAGGTCHIVACAAGYSDCNGLPGDGCEVADASFATDPQNCGACGVVCAPANGSGACVMGVCKVASCAPGFFDCNQAPGDGCEVAAGDFQTDPKNCGGCGVACAPAHATGACAMGVCAIGACAPGYVDLDQKAANGCEYACTKTANDDVTCDGADDDCDGQVDEDYVPVPCGQGACAAMSKCALGVASCTPGAPSVEGPAGSATCSNGVDDDCDGLVDTADVDCTTAACQSDADCDDGNPCTEDTCAAGFCSHSGVECDGGSMGGGGSGGSTSSSASSGGASSSSGAGGSKSSSSGGGGESASGGGGGGVPGDQGSCACRAGAGEEADGRLGLLAVVVGAAFSRRRRRARRG